MVRVAVTGARVGPAHAQQRRSSRTGPLLGVTAGVTVVLLLLLHFFAAPTATASKSPPERRALEEDGGLPPRLPGLKDAIRQRKARSLVDLRAPPPPVPADPPPPVTPEPPEPTPAPPVPTPVPKQDTTEWYNEASVEVFSTPDCSGQALVVQATHAEERCANCWDACGKEFPDGSSAHSDSGSQVRSLRVKGPIVVLTSEACLGTYDYSGRGWAEQLSSEDECAVRNPGHIRMQALPPPASPVELPEAGLLVYPKRNCKGIPVVVPTTDCEGDLDEGHAGCASLCPSGSYAMRSARVLGEREFDLYEDCKGKQYWASLFNSDGCVNMFDWPSTNFVAQVKQGSLTVSTETNKPNVPPRFRVVWSGESSNYFAFQTQSNLYAFETSGQSADGGGWARLMTSSSYDDLAETFPTFSAKRHPYSRRYSPINKGDVLAKWFASVDAPGPDEILVVIDPDNWLLQSLAPHLEGVTKGHASAQAAWYVHNVAGVTEMWKQFCEQNCDWKLDLVAVPIFIHRDDMEKIAPLWVKYSLLIKERLEWDKVFLRRYNYLQVDWCAEMYGYVFAAAHAGIPHKVVPSLQVRDVDTPPPRAEQDKIPMIHMGRAWFPKSYGCKEWCHTEGKEWSYRGQQVWCKCNKTASDIIPWPLPEGEMDFVSRHTLTILHNSREKYGPIPRSKYRPGNDRGATYP
eukprot:Hpha_TRINITY_DN7037_c0_g1::TRINITY_DN7037_c0_g1_i1::g.22931::m.22931/K20781/SGT1; peptidyl serine alpha-galactosyltransferase